MDDVEFLKARREENKEWMRDFRKRYGFPEQRKCDHLTPAQRLDNACHHAEYGEAAH